MHTCRATTWHVCVSVCLWACVFTCVTIQTPALPSAPMQRALSPKQTFSLYGRGHCLNPRTVPLTLPQLKPKHTVCYGWKKTVQKGLGEERKAFPETHLVLMQGPLVWITGTYYRRTQADPSNLSQGEMGAEGLWAWGAEGWIETCGQAAAPNDWCPSSMRGFLWDLFWSHLLNNREKSNFFSWTS